MMNLPNKLKNRGMSSSDSEDEPVARQHIIEDLKAKTNRKFKLKEIDDELVLQKYEDLMNSQQEEPTVPSALEESEEEGETSREF